MGISNKLLWLFLWGGDVAYPLKAAFFCPEVDLNVNIYINATTTGYTCSVSVCTQMFHAFLFKSSQAALSPLWNGIMSMQTIKKMKQRKYMLCTCLQLDHFIISCIILYTFFLIVFCACSFLSGLVLPVSVNGRPDSTVHLLCVNCFGSVLVVAWWTRGKMVNTCFLNHHHHPTCDVSKTPTHAYSPCIQSNPCIQTLPGLIRQNSHESWEFHINPNRDKYCYIMTWHVSWMAVINSYCWTHPVLTARFSWPRVARTSRLRLQTRRQII